MEFTEQEVKKELEQMGYRNVPRLKLLEFMKDLKELIKSEQTCEADSCSQGESSFEMRSTSPEENTQTSYTQQPLKERNRQYPTAFSKQKVPSGHSFLDKENLPLYNSYIDTSSILSSTLNSSNMSHNQDSDISIHQNTSTLKRIVAKSNNSSTESTLTSNHDIRNNVPAFIRPSSPTKRIRKCDPVDRYHHYKEEWRHNKIPGTSNHPRLRWNIKEKMLHCEVFEKPRRNYQSNNYIVPTEKKRQALRWQVRTALAKTLN